MGLDSLVIPLGVAAGAGAVALAWASHSHLYVPVPPNKALVLFGQRSTKSPAAPGAQASSGRRLPRFLTGGGAFVAPWNRNYGFLPLNTIDVDVAVRATTARPDSRGWFLRLGLQVRVPPDEVALRSAAENLLGKSEDEIRALVRRTVEGCVPAVLTSLPPDTWQNDWVRLAAEVQVTAAPELVAYGLTIRSLMVKEVRSPGAPSVPDASWGPSSAFDPGYLPAQADILDRLHRLEVQLEQVEQGLGTAMGLLVRWGHELPPEARDPVSSFAIFETDRPRVPALIGAPGWEPGGASPRIPDHDSTAREPSEASRDLSAVRAKDPPREEARA